MTNAHLNTEQITPPSNDEAGIRVGGSKPKDSLMPGDSQGVETANGNINSSGPEQRAEFA